MTGQRWAVAPVPWAVDDLVSGVAAGLGASILRYKRIEFPNQNILIDVDLETVPSDVDHVLLVAQGSVPHDGEIMQLGLIADALKRIRPVAVHCLLRYLPYSRSNRCTAPGVALGAKVYIDMLCALQIDAFVTFNLHAAELVGFFSKPIYLLDTLPAAARQLRAEGRTYDLVVGTDRGRQEECTFLADAFGAEVEYFTKRRRGHDGEVLTFERTMTRTHGRKALLFDDEIDSGRSAANASRLLAEGGVQRVDFFTIYDVAQAGAFDRLVATPRLGKVYRTNASLRSSLSELPVHSCTFDLAPLLCELYRPHSNGDAAGLDPVAPMHAAPGGPPVESFR